MSPAVLDLVEAALRGGFVLLMLLLVPRLWQAAALPEARLGAALALGSAVYALQSALLARGPLQAWQAPLQALATGNPVVLLLLSWSLFDDRFRLRRWHGAAWLAWVALSLGNCYGWHAGTLARVLEAAPLVLALAALWPVLRFWRGDLVEARLKLRGRIVLAVVGYTVLSTAVGLPSGGAGAPGWLRLADAALLLWVGLAAAWPLLSLSPDGVLPGSMSGVLPHPVPGPQAEHSPEPWAPPLPSLAEAAGAGSGPVTADSAGHAPNAGAAADVAEHDADALALHRLQRAITERQPWRREGLTIGRLADELGLPEYRLRRVINRRLGHRNFNAFLNSHRVAHAKQLLADAGQAGTPVLTVALDAGFQSLGPFNRAFKADTGLTPSEFRRQALGASAADAPNPAIAG